MMNAEQVKNLLGSWAGPAFTYDSYQRVTFRKPLLLRIHSFDPAANKIEITEIGYSFDTGAEISNPKKMMYGTRFDGTSLIIVFDRVIFGSKEIKLTPEYNNEIYMLRASCEGDKDKKTRSAFLITKSSDDTSTFVKPAQPITVEVIPNPIKFEKLDPK